jgi:Peptidase family M28
MLGARPSTDGRQATRVVDIRIYRATFVLALLALVVLMFSLGARPAPLGAELAPDAFDDPGAYATTTQIVEGQPDRRPGSAGDEAVAASVEQRLAALGFQTSSDRFAADVYGKDTTLTNITGVLSGSSERQLLVVADRDAVKPPGASSASSTAVLLELARALAAVRHQKTLVFLSADGGDADGAGVRHFADSYPDKGKLDAALVIDDVAAANARRPYLVPWSTNDRRGSLQLLRTADAALRHEGGGGAGSYSAFGQFVHQMWPLTLRPQGPLVGAGIDSITLTDRGELPRPPGGDTLAGLSRLRLAKFGKSALSTLFALDAAPGLKRSPSGYIVLGNQVLPRWSIALLVLGLLAPAFVTALDAFARARRRGRAVGRWLRWALASSAPILAAILAARLFELFGWLPKTASEAIAPATSGRFSDSVAALGVVAAIVVLGWLFLRPLAAGVREAPRRADVPEAAIALTLLLSVEIALVWLADPFAALLLVPVLHLCLLTAMPEGPNRRLLLAGTVFAALLLPAIVVVYYGLTLGIGGDLTAYASLLLSGQDSIWAALLESAVAGSLISAIVVALVRPPLEKRAKITVRGPSTYAGPGSLGGTESAFRR